MRNIAIILVAIIGLNAYGQQPLSLSDAIRIGLENNYDLQVIRNDEDVAGINNTWGNTSLMPDISFSASLRENYNYNDDENYRQQTLVPSVTLNWVVFNGFSARINKQRFEELEQQSAGNTVVLVESTIQDIILAYNNCLLQNQLVEVYGELAKLSEDRYNRALDSRNIGAGTTYEATQAKTSWLEDQSNYLQQKVTYDNAIRSLNFIMAVADETVWEFTTELETDTPDYDLLVMEEKLLGNNATLKNQYLYQSLLAKETKLAKGAFLPALSVNAGLQNTDLGYYYAGSSADYLQNSSDAYVGLTLSWDIFNGGSRKRSVQISQINEESAQVQTNQMEHSLTNQLLQMHSSYQVYKSVLTLAEEQLASAKLNLDLSEDKFKNGSINSFNYRDAQITYMNAAISKLRAIYNVIQSNTDLLRITGGIISEYE